MDTSSLLAVGAERCGEVSRVLTNPYVDPVWIWGDIWDPHRGQVDCVETAFVMDVWLIDDALAGDSGWQLVQLPAD